MGLDENGIVRIGIGRNGENREKTDGIVRGFRRQRTAVPCTRRLNLYILSYFLIRDMQYGSRNPGHHNYVYDFHMQTSVSILFHSLVDNVEVSFSYTSFDPIGKVGILLNKTASGNLRSNLQTRMSLIPTLGFWDLYL